MEIKFNHIGLPVDHKLPDMVEFGDKQGYGLKPVGNPFHIEYLYYKEDAVSPVEMRTQPHICFEMEDMTPYLTEEYVDRIVYGPFSSLEGDHWGVFVMKDGLLIEYYSKNEPDMKALKSLEE